jgi:uncharacterized lipoprotein YmbA
MMHMTRLLCRRVAAAAIGVGLLAASGCSGLPGGTPVTSFYVLTALPKAEASAAGKAQELAVGVGPIDIPEYLKRPQIVTRASENRLDVAEFDQWGGNLEDNVTAVVAENLSRLLSTDNVATYPWRASQPIDYEVEIEVIEFERGPSGSVELAVQWNLFGEDGTKALAAKRSDFSEAVAADDYGSIVAAMSRALGALSREIAAALRARAGS